MKLHLASLPLAILTLCFFQPLAHASNPRTPVVTPASADEAADSSTNAPAAAEEAAESADAIKAKIESHSLTVEPGTKGEAPAASASDSDDGMTIQMKPVKKDKHQAHEAAPAAPTETAHAVAKVATGNEVVVAGTSADKALHWLQNGNTRFVKKHFRADGKSPKDRTRLAKEGAHPHTIILAPSDSIVPPELIFDQALGEIEVIRTFGENPDASAIAAIEAVLQRPAAPQLLVVLGANQSPAIAAAMKFDQNDESNTNSLDMKKSLSEIKSRLKTAEKDPPSANLDVEGILNADGIARELPKHSELIQTKVQGGSLTIKPALYRQESGKVSFY